MRTCESRWKSERSNGRGRWSGKEQSENHVKDMKNAMLTQHEQAQKANENMKAAMRHQAKEAENAHQQAQQSSPTPKARILHDVRKTADRGCTHNFTMQHIRFRSFTIAFPVMYVWLGCLGDSLPLGDCVAFCYANCRYAPRGILSGPCKIAS